jgi:hypothetical protein
MSEYPILLGNMGLFSEQYRAILPILHAFKKKNLHCMSI